ncbi:MAG: hypothetical protein ACOCRX_12065, partial [Candidatus Woesearchaeota archaeon]
MEKASQQILNDLSNYQKSYKFVVYKAFFAMQKNGQANLKDMMGYIKNFYLDRKENGLMIETDNTASEITEINNTSLKKLQNYIERMPLARLNTLNKREIIELDRDIWNKLNQNDIVEINNLIEDKLVRYYEEVVRDEYKPKYFSRVNLAEQLNNINIWWVNQGKSN